MTRNALIRKLYAMVDERGTQRAVAKYLGVSEIYLSDVLRGKRNPGERILSKFGLQPEIIYVSAERRVVVQRRRQVEAV